MKLFYKIFIALLATLMLIWGITTLSDRMRGKGTFIPFTLYSEVVQAFASLEPTGEGDTRYFDHLGRQYTETQFDSILPSFYSRQLVMDGRFPDTLRGRAVTPQYIEQEGFIFISHPSTLNTHTTPLYFLLESRSKRVNLEMPPDVFRFTDKGIEFVNIKENQIDRHKSDTFQKIFDQKGVTFPIRRIAGNPTTRKAYDNGYLIIDHKYQLYHFKQVVGQPFLRPIELPEGMIPAELFVTEYAARRHLGFVTDSQGAFYALRLPNYTLTKADLPPFNIRQDKVTIFGNPFFWTVVLSGDSRVDYFALEADNLKSVDSLHFDVTNPKGIADYLLPFQLRFTSSTDEYFRPHIGDWSLLGTILWLTLITLALRRKHR